MKMFGLDDFAELQPFTFFVYVTRICSIARAGSNIG